MAQHLKHIHVSIRCTSKNFEETKRHRRLCKKASRLDVKDLLEICVLKGMNANDIPGNGASSSAAGTPAAGSSAGSSGSGGAGPGPQADAAPSRNPSQEHVRGNRATDAHEEHVPARDE